MITKYLLLLFSICNALLGEDGHGIWLHNNDKLCCSNSYTNDCINSYPCVSVNLNICPKRLHDIFVKYMARFNKQYSSVEEFSYRFNIFSHNFAKSRYQNEFYKSYYSNVDNEFSDLSYLEFESLQGVKFYNKISNYSYISNSSGLTKKSIDWREKGIVNQIKNQGTCGSCWTFSTVASIESGYAKKYNNLISLSEQNLIDCVKKDKINDENTCCNGCNGGLMDNAFDYIIKKQSGGIDTENSYPYQAKDQPCSFSTINIGARIEGWVDVPMGDEISLANAVAEVGVVSIALDASKQWQLYRSGILQPREFDGCSNDPQKADHGVAIVGYGTENNIDYWIIRNSWGTSWGENGYIRLIRGINACGVANYASYPIIS